MSIEAVRRHVAEAALSELYAALHVGQVVKVTLLYYRAERTADETFTAFVQRIGAEALQKKLAALAQVPPPEKAACYRDLGADGDFRIGAKRGERAA